MQGPEHNDEVNKSKNPLKGSVFDRPGPLYPGFVRSKPKAFEQIMRTNRRGMFIAFGAAYLGLAVTGISLCNSKRKR